MWLSEKFFWMSGKFLGVVYKEFADKIYKLVRYFAEMWPMQGKSKIYN